MFVQDALLNRARIQPDKLAFIIDGAFYSCGDMRASASRMAQELRSAGVARDNQAAIFLPDYGESDCTIIGAFKAAAVFAAMNRTTKHGKPLQKLNGCGANVLVTSEVVAAPDPLDQIIAQVPPLDRVLSAGNSV